MRPIFPSGMSSRGGLTLGFFVLLAAGLFFIPEIIHFKRSLSSGPTTEATPEEETETPSEPEGVVEEEPQQTSSADPLSRVLTKFKRGEFQEQETEEEVQNLGGLTPEEQEIAQIVKSEQLNWKQLTSKPVTNRVSQAHKIGTELLKTLDKKYKRARWALVTYVNALGGFLRGEVKEMNPREYLDYLTRLDLAVTRAMIEDQVRKSEYSRWKEMSLVPLLSQATVSARESHTPPFVTDVVLTEVSVREKPGDQKTRAHAVLRVRGFVLGSEAKELQIARNNVLMKSVVLRNKGDAKSFTFDDKTVYGDPVYTFRILDGAGHGLDKLYRFVGVARRYPRGQDGSYRLPSLPRVNAREYIPQVLDRIFFTGIVKGNASRPSTGKRSDLGGYTSF